MEEGEGIRVVAQQWDHDGGEGVFGGRDMLEIGNEVGPSGMEMRPWEVLMLRLNL